MQLVKLQRIQFSPNPTFPVPSHSGASPADAKIFGRTDRWTEASVWEIKPPDLCFRLWNWSKAIFRVFSQNRSPSRRQAVPITLSQRGSLEEDSSEVVRQSPCSHGQHSYTNPAVFLFHILFSIILFCLKTENTNVKGLTSLGLNGCESGHKWAASASNYYLSKSLEGWRQSKVAIIKCSLL